MPLSQYLRHDNLAGGTLILTCARGGGKLLACAARFGLWAGFAQAVAGAFYLVFTAHLPSHVYGVGPDLPSFIVFFVKTTFAG